jgi:hypothetical protein
VFPEVGVVQRTEESLERREAGDPGRWRPSCDGRSMRGVVVHIHVSSDVAEVQSQLCARLGLTGDVRLAIEGISGSVRGSFDSVAK